jgi:protein TonB
VGMGMGSGNGAAGGLIGGIGSAPAPIVKQAPPQKIRISGGVIQGNLVYGPQPLYPAIAKAAHVSGTVVLAATISKAGTIENLHAVSGSPMLVNAAISAVQQYRYKPYMLGDTAVEVETTINVIFNLN